MKSLISFGIDPLKPTRTVCGPNHSPEGDHSSGPCATSHIEKGAQIVLCAGAPDTQEIADKMRAEVERARALTPNKIIWIPEMVPVECLIPLYGHAAVFVCPSVYEPFGIINLEAMACGTPVVASARGRGSRKWCWMGKPASSGPFEAGRPAQTRSHAARRLYVRDLAGAINDLLRDARKTAEG